MNTALAAQFDRDQAEMLPDLGILCGFEAEFASSMSRQNLAKALIFFENAPDASYADFMRDRANINASSVTVSTKHGVARNSNYSNWTVESDPSIQVSSNFKYPIEVISPVGTIEQTLARLKLVFSIIEKGPAGKDKIGFTNNSTGLHITFSSKSVDTSKVDPLKLAVLLGESHWAQFFDRMQNGYAARLVGAFEKHINKILSDASSDISGALPSVRKFVATVADGDLSWAPFSEQARYWAVNMTKSARGLVEFRLPGGTGYQHKIDKIEILLRRFAFALWASSRPEAYREYYLKKLMRLALRNYRVVSNKEEMKNSLLSLTPTLRRAQVNGTDMTVFAYHEQTAKSANSNPVLVIPAVFDEGIYLFSKLSSGANKATITFPSPSGESKSGNYYSIGAISGDSGFSNLSVFLSSEYAGSSTSRRLTVGFLVGDFVIPKPIRIRGGGSALAALDLSTVSADISGTRSLHEIVRTLALADTKEYSGAEEKIIQNNIRVIQDSNLLSYSLDPILDAADSSDVLLRLQKFLEPQIKKAWSQEHHFMGTLADPLMLNAGAGISRPDWTPANAAKSIPDYGPAPRFSSTSLQRYISRIHSLGLPPHYNADALLYLISHEKLSVFDEALPSLDSLTADETAFFTESLSLLSDDIKYRIFGNAVLNSSVLRGGTDPVTDGPVKLLITTLLKGQPDIPPTDDFSTAPMSNQFEAVIRSQIVSYLSDVDIPRPTVARISALLKESLPVFTASFEAWVESKSYLKYKQAIDSGNLQEALSYAISQRAGGAVQLAVLGDKTAFNVSRLIMSAVHDSKDLDRMTAADALKVITWAFLRGYLTADEFPEQLIELDGAEDIVSDVMFRDIDALKSFPPQYDNILDVFPDIRNHFLRFASERISAKHYASPADNAALACDALMLGVRKNGLAELDSTALAFYQSVRKLSNLQSAGVLGLTVVSLLTHLSAAIELPTPLPSTPFFQALGKEYQELRRRGGTVPEQIDKLFSGFALPARTTARPVVAYPEALAPISIPQATPSEFPADMPWGTHVSPHDMASFFKNDGGYDRSLVTVPVTEFVRSNLNAWTPQQLDVFMSLPYNDEMTFRRILASSVLASTSTGILAGSLNSNVLAGFASDETAMAALVRSTVTRLFNGDSSYLTVRDSIFGMSGLDYWKCLLYFMAQESTKTLESPKSGSRPSLSSALSNLQATGLPFEMFSGINFLRAYRYMVRNKLIVAPRKGLSFAAVDMDALISMFSSYSPNPLATKRCALYDAFAKRVIESDPLHGQAWLEDMAKRNAILPPVPG